MSGRAPWRTPADAAELAVIVADLLDGIERHRTRCGTCRALARPCPVRAEIAADPFADFPLDAPRGFYVERRERLREHTATCETCRLASVGSCRATTEAIEIAIDWSWRRKIRSRADFLRRQLIRERFAEIQGAA